MIIYIDNILIYSKIKEKYIRYIRAIFKVLKRNIFKVKLEKLIFYIKKVDFLKYVIISRKVKIKSEKVNRIFIKSKLKSKNEI